MLVAPAVMTLLGDRAWWLPGWLDRLLPRIDLEGEEQAEAPGGAERHRQRAPHPQGQPAPADAGE
jgi:RND superfamily putative drug exporter